MLPFWTSYLIRTYAWMIILRDNGVLNGFLRTIGLIDEPLILLNTDISVILGMTYGFLPFAILPLFVSIDRLDQNLVQAARDLYASGRAAFLHVTLPLTMPGIIAASLLTFIPAIGDYVTPDLLGGAQTTTAAKIVQVALHERPGLAVRLGARVHPDGADAGWDAARPAVAAAGDVRVRRSLDEGPESLAVGLRRRDLRVPVRPDRRPDHLQLQRFAGASDLHLARLHASTGIRGCSRTTTSSTPSASRSRWRRSP